MSSQESSNWVDGSCLSTVIQTEYQATESDCVGQALKKMRNSDRKSGGEADCGATSGGGEETPKNAKNDNIVEVASHSGTSHSADTVIVAMMNMITIDGFRPQEIIERTNAKNCLEISTVSPVHTSTVKIWSHSDSAEMDPWELITMAIRDLHLSQIAPTSMNFFQAPNGMFGDFWKSKKCNVNLNRNNKNFDQNKNIFSTFSWTIPTVMATCDASPVQGTSMSENCLVVADFIVFWWSSIGFTTDNCSAPLSTRAGGGLQSIWNNILISKNIKSTMKKYSKKLKIFTWHDASWWVGWIPSSWNCWLGLRDDWCSWCDLWDWCYWCGWLCGLFWLDVGPIISLKIF